MNELKILSKVLREWAKNSDDNDATPTAIQLSRLINIAIDLSKQKDNIQSNSAATDDASSVLYTAHTNAADAAFITPSQLKMPGDDCI